jgi:hypothetical protein
VSPHIRHARLGKQAQHAELDLGPAIEHRSHVIDRGLRVTDPGRQITDPFASGRRSETDRVLDQIEGALLARFGAQDPGEGEDLTDRGHAQKD